MLNSSFFESIKIGFKPAFIIELTVAANVKTGIIISSFFSKFKDLRANSIPVVPLLTARDFLERYFSNFFQILLQMALLMIASLYPNIFLHTNILFQI